jgi:hypothetical protein
MSSSRPGPGSDRAVSPQGASIVKGGVHEAGAEERLHNAVMEAHPISMCLDQAEPLTAGRGQRKPRQVAVDIPVIANSFVQSLVQLFPDLWLR